MRIFLFIFICLNFLYSAEIFKINNNVYELDPKTLSLTLKTKNEVIKISYENDAKDFKILDKNNTDINFIRDGIKINFKFLNDKVIAKTSANNNKITFPIIKNSSEFIFPINSGKKIPTNDKIFNSYLKKF